MYNFRERKSSLQQTFIFFVEVFFEQCQLGVGLLELLFKACHLLVSCHSLSFSLPLIVGHILHQPLSPWCDFELLVTKSAPGWEVGVEFCHNNFEGTCTITFGVGALSEEGFGLTTASRARTFKSH